MSTNDYYDPVPITQHSSGRSSGVNNNLTAVRDGFIKIPAELILKRGKVQDAVDSGAVNAYVLTATYAPSSYAANDTYRFRALNTNDGAATVDIYDADSALIGVAEVRNYAGAALSGGEILAGASTTIVYDATGGYFRIVSPVANISSVTVNNNVKVSGNDSTPGDIETKIVVSGDLTLSTENDGGDERRRITHTPYWNAPRVVTNSDSPVAALDRDVIMVRTSTGAVEIDFPATGRVKIVDIDGEASANNITIDPAGADTTTFDIIDSNYFEGIWQRRPSGTNWDLI